MKIVIKAMLMVSAVTGICLASGAGGFMFEMVIGAGAEPHPASAKRYACITTYTSADAQVGSVCDSVTVRHGLISLFVGPGVLGGESGQAALMSVQLNGVEIANRITIPASAYALRADTAQAALWSFWADSLLRLKGSLDGVIDSTYGWETPAPRAAVHVDNHGNVGIGTNQADSLAARAVVTGGDVTISSLERGIILTSPNGKRWRLFADGDKVSVSNHQIDISPIINLLLLD